MFPYEIWSFNESKIVKRVNRGTPARHCARPRPYRCLNAGEPLHVSFIPAILVVRAPLFSSLGREGSSAIHSVPLPRTTAKPCNPSTAARRTGVRADHPSSPCPDSSRSELRDLAPKLLHPSTNAAVPYPRRNRAADDVRHCRSPSSFAPTSSSLSRPSSASNRTTVSSPMTSSRSPTLSLPESATIADDWPPCRRERAARRARPPRGSSAPARGPTPHAPPLLDLPGARLAAWPPPPPPAGLERPRAADAMPLRHR